MIPLPFGQIRVTVQHTVTDEFNDPTYTDAFQIDGCLEFPGFSVRGGQRGNEESNVVTDQRTLYLPPEAPEVLATDRIIIHPPGVALIPAGSPLRRTNAYQVIGRPMEWVHAMTGWAPGIEVALQRVY